MKPKFKTNLFNNRHVIGYHTNHFADISSFTTNHYIFTDDELKDVLWIADQYLAHAFHVSSDNGCAFYGHFIGLEGDEIVLFMKLQSSTPLFATTRNKTAIKHFKVSCNLDAHLVMVLHPLVMSIRPPTHVFVHKCCMKLPPCKCMGAHDPYYLDHSP